MSVEVFFCGLFVVVLNNNLIGMRGSKGVFVY